MEGLQLTVMLLSFTLLGVRLGPQGFGAYVSMYALIGILGGFVYSGVSLTVVQHLVRDGQDLANTVRSSLGLVLSVGAVAAALGTAAGSLLVPGISVATLAMFMVAELMGTAAVEVVAAAAFARDGVAVAARYRVLPLLTKLIVLLSLFSAGSLDVETLGLAYLILYPCLAAVVAVLVGRRYGIRVGIGRPRWSLARDSGLYSATISAVVVQNDSDKIVLTASQAGAEAGLYAAAYRIVSFGMVPLRALLAATHRTFLQHDSSARGEHVSRALRFAGIGLLYAAVFAAVLVLTAPLVVTVLGDAYEGTVPMLRVLAPLIALRVLSQFGLNGLLGFGRVGLRTLITAFTAAVALVAYVALVPSFGWQGAVAGTVVGELVLITLAWAGLVRLQRRHDRAVPACQGDRSTRASVDS